MDFTQKFIPTVFFRVPVNRTLHHMATGSYIFSVRFLYSSDRCSSRVFPSGSGIPLTGKNQKLKNTGQWSEASTLGVTSGKRSNWKSILPGSRLPGWGR